MIILYNFVILKPVNSDNFDNSVIFKPVNFGILCITTNPQSHP